MLAEEDRAYAMLYSGLDDEQQRTLPDRAAGCVSD
ncbi:DUF6400 family protein [Candidatus Mycobacterium methanotrophicum]|uniref:DUF6400 family protein n=1 Tax=Candidatus Mycobacterium methanotrophicum TaxID=2943498 RepID=A0ABY4QGZ1_9MYCO|nr:DUF6400 family protein [Candidatus Mycobacterium methanotrophicum]UQX10243.1 DUF6400 family protein [Candidatus Mycobacterium methanotrophicum]